MVSIWECFSLGLDLVFFSFFFFHIIFKSVEIIDPNYDSCDYK